MQNSIYERNKKWFDVVNIVQRVASIIFVISMIFLPIRTFEFLIEKDFTLLQIWSDSLGSEPELGELGGLAIITLSMVFMATSVILDNIIMRQVKKEEWEEKTSLFVFLSVVGIVLFVVGRFIFDTGFDQAMIDLYDAPYDLESGSGALLMWIGIINPVIVLIKTYNLKQVQQGKKEEDVFKTNFNNSVKSETSSSVTSSQELKSNNEVNKTTQENIVASKEESNK